MAKFCIVGMGFSGACLFNSLITKLLNNGISGVEVITIEKGQVNGPGYPYSKGTILPSHLCNNQAGMMSLFENDFVDWMRANVKRLEMEFLPSLKETHKDIEEKGWWPDEDVFYSREIFGEYLKDRVEELRILAMKGGIIVNQLNNCEVTNLSEAAGTLTLNYVDNNKKKHLKLEKVNEVLLATGHWEAKKNKWFDLDTYLSSPYPYHKVVDLIRKNKEKEITLFVKGMGPSGVDAIMTSSLFGEFVRDENGMLKYYPGKNNSIKIVCGSRSGFFPAVRSAKRQYNFKFLDDENFSSTTIGLEFVLDQVDKELRCLSSNNITFEDVVNPKYTTAKDKLQRDLSFQNHVEIIHEVVLKIRRNKFYNKMSAEDKKVYDEQFDRHFIRCAVPMPRTNGEKLLALMKAGILEAVKLPQKNAGIEYRDGKYNVQYLREGMEKDTFECDIVIHAAGYNYDLSCNSSSLVKNLLNKGMIVENKEGEYLTGGIALNIEAGYRVMKKDGDCIVESDMISSYGPLVRYWQNEHNYAGAFVEAADCVSNEWLINLLSGKYRQ